MLANFPSIRIDRFYLTENNFAKYSAIIIRQVLKIQANLLGSYDIFLFFHVVDINYESKGKK